MCRQQGVSFFELSSLAKGIQFANFSRFGQGRGMIFGNLVDFSLGKGMLWLFWSKKCQTSVIPAKTKIFKFWSRDCTNLASFVQKMPTHGILYVEITLAKGILFTKISLANGA